MEIKCWEPVEIEETEYEEFIRMQMYLADRLDRVFIGLNSRLEIKKDWEHEFKGSSDLDKGAERIFHHIYATLYSFPNSCPIGSDLMYETYKSFVHIDIKTISTRNKQDYFGKVNLERNQTSYSYDFFKAALPPFYSKTFKDEKDGSIRDKLCVAFIIYILHELGKKDILSVLLINVPNGALKNFYGNIIQAGKRGKAKATNARFRYSDFLEYRLLENKYRVISLYRKRNLENITGWNLAVPAYYEE